MPVQRHKIPPRSHNARRWSKGLAGRLGFDTRTAYMAHNDTLRELARPYFDFETEPLFRWQELPKVWDRFVQEVCKKFPEYEQYERGWPLWAYLKRYNENKMREKQYKADIEERAQSIDSMKSAPDDDYRPSSPEEDTPAPRSTVPRESLRGRPHPELEVEILVGATHISTALNCPAAAPVRSNRGSVAIILSEGEQAVAAFLDQAHLGSETWLGPFLRAGIHGEDELHGLADASEAWMDKFLRAVARESKVRVTLFHRVMFKNALQQMAGGAEECFV